MPAGKPMLSAVLRIGAELNLLGCKKPPKGTHMTLAVPYSTFCKLQDETRTGGASVEVRTSWGRIEVRPCGI